MSKPVVLFISDVPDFKGGAERSLFDLMANPYIEAELCVPAEGEISKAATEKSIPFHTLDYGSVLTVRRPFKIRDIFRTFFAALRAASALKKLSKTRGASYVHTNGLKAHGVACLARLCSGRPVIAHFRAVPFTKLEKLFWRAVQIIATHLVLVSRPCWPGKKLPVNTHVIFNGIHLPDRAILPPLPPKTPFILGFVGRIQFTKGVDTLIEWFDSAHKKGLDIKLIIRGEAAPDEMDYDKKIHRMVKDRGLEKLCLFEGRVEGFDKIYGGIHANIVSSVIPDPLPRSVMEACALGIPVLGYPAGGIPYMFTDKKSGFLVKNENEFYEVLKNLIKDEALYKSVSKAAIENAQDNFAMDRLHKGVAKLYQTGD